MTLKYITADKNGNFNGTYEPEFSSILSRSLAHVIIYGTTFQTDYVSMKLLKKIMSHRG